MVGAVFGLPDYNPRIKEIDGRLFPFGFLQLLRNKRAIKRIRVISTNVLPEYQRMGVGLVLMHGLVPKAHGMGHRRGRVLLGARIELALPRQPEKRRGEDHQDVSAVRFRGEVRAADAYRRLAAARISCQACSTCRRSVLVWPIDMRSVSLPSSRVWRQDRAGRRR